MGYQSVRDYFPGIGEAVADRTVNRNIFTEAQREALGNSLTLNPNDPAIKHWVVPAELSNFPVVLDEEAPFRADKPELRRETWPEVAQRVAEGNVGLVAWPKGKEAQEFARLRDHLQSGTLLMSGRHLQHGDRNQASRPMEVFTNCGRYDTEVMTLEKGVVQIGAVVGETLTVRTADGEWRPAKFHQHGKQKLYELTFVGKNGRGKRVVHFTRDHRWLLADGSVTTSIKPGDTLRSAPVHGIRDPEAVIHGLIYGDGTAHKGRRDHGRPGVSMGRTYASIRVCKRDAVRDEIHEILDDAGYNYTTPAHANGDRVYYIGKFAHAKELPFTRDPDYVAGFIYGWWLADGHKTEPNGTWTISTSDELAADWLCENSMIAGLSVVSSIVKVQKAGDGSFANGKDLTVVRLREGVEWKLSSIEEGDVEEVYCPEEPVTSSFVLANGLLTGNCSTSAFSFLLFYLLLNGSGVGRAYDDALMVTDWRKMPTVYVAIDDDHEDRTKFENGQPVIDPAIHSLAWFERQFERGLIKSADQKVTVFHVPDSRGGWAKAIELIERMAFEGRADEIVIIDFSKVRGKNRPIKGMQYRPSSGPAPIMSAIMKVAALKFEDYEPWLAAMFVDHFLSECVLVGGARRAARMACKNWRDKTIFDFIAIKRKHALWSSNNSVTIDQEFRDAATKVVGLLTNFEPGTPGADLEASDLALEGKITEIELHAYQVLIAVASAAYYDGTGEPGIINQDRLNVQEDGIEEYVDGLFAWSRDFAPDAASLDMIQATARQCMGLVYKMIVNPCGEIALLLLGAYCVIADTVLFHAKDDNMGEDAMRTAVRALMRTNTMNSLYDREVKRTNRIGVGITGFHEWAYDRFGFGWKDIVDEKKSKKMWLTLSRFKRAIVDESKRYAKELGVAVPHTNTTFKPAGTTSKLFGLTEGAHLPAMRWYLRWVQFRHDDPLIDEYEAKGYPVRRDLKTYSNTTIVGFPTAPTICQLGDGEWVTTASEATPEEQYEFLRLLEKYWIVGVAADGKTPLADTGNQVSYTLKYDPAKVNFGQFLRTLIDGQFSIRCCSVMPQVDTTAYEYQPEEPLSKEQYDELVSRIATNGNIKEDVDFSHIDCGTGGCPIDFNDEDKKAA